MANQLLLKDPVNLLCAQRLWKVTLIGEGADDAGGVFDETLAQMCEELESVTEVKLLTRTPNSINKCGFNTDRFVFNPECTDFKLFKFFGILCGVGIRTKRPLNLHLAPPMWKLVAGMNLTIQDLEEIDLLFTRALVGIRDVDKGGVTEDTFSEMIPLECFEAQSMSGQFVPIVPNGHDIKLTFKNRNEYFEKALHFRLHELDKQVW
uniref:HECT domain-containing protein n=1 Tax=Amphimedon queenslandica TaxID=400682 RepID=A0A1X7TGG7_AMPQE